MMSLARPEGDCSGGLQGKALQTAGRLTLSAVAERDAQPSPGADRLVVSENLPLFGPGDVLDRHLQLSLSPPLMQRLRIHDGINRNPAVFQPRLGTFAGEADVDAQPISPLSPSLFGLQTWSRLARESQRGVFQADGELCAEMLTS
jgi:hypothetical protein